MDNEFSIKHLKLRQLDATIGLGVFSEIDYEKGDLVEISPIVTVSTPYSSLEASLQQRVFAWGKLTGDDIPFALALGYGSLYNHANPANLCFSARVVERVILFKAARKIKSGEQLTINYNGQYGDNVSDKDTWFKWANVEPIDLKDTATQ